MLVLVMSFIRECVMGGCEVGGHPLQVCAEASLSCCEFRHLVFFFLVFFFYSTVTFCFSEACFPRIYCLNSTSWVCRFIYVVFLVAF